jgi:hypothetical protein
VCIDTKRQSAVTTCSSELEGTDSSSFWKILLYIVCVETPLEPRLVLEGHRTTFHRRKISAGQARDRADEAELQLLLGPRPCTLVRRPARRRRERLAHRPRCGVAERLRRGDIPVGAPCFLKRLGDSCLNRSMVTRPHAPRQPRGTHGRALPPAGRGRLTWWRRRLRSVQQLPSSRSSSAQGRQ